MKYGLFISLLVSVLSTPAMMKDLSPSCDDGRIPSSTAALTTTSPCKTKLEGLHPFSPDSQTLDKWLNEDTANMKTLTRSGDDILPPVFRKVTKTERIKNEIFFAVFKTVRKFILSHPKNGFVNSLASIMNKIEGSPFNFLIKGSIFTRLSLLLNHPTILQSEGRRDLSRFAKFQKEFDSDINLDKTTYGADFFDKETLAQGAINSFAIKLFALLNDSKPPYDRFSANAISLLHPIVDAAMDKGQMTKSTFKKLANYLSKAEKPELESEYERLLFGYLDRFEKTFPRQEVPGFWFSLERLFLAQVKSMDQIRKDYEEDAYFRLSLDKGGLSTVLAAYTALGPLNEKQYAFFYRSGGIFQVIDDLLDIKKDRHEGVRTVWTHAISERKSFSIPLSQLLALETNFESHMVELADGFSNPKEFSNVYTFSFKLSVLRALARQYHYLDADTKALIGNRLSLSLSSIHQLMTEGLLESQQKENSDPDLLFLNQLIQDTETY